MFQTLSLIAIAVCAIGGGLSQAKSKLDDLPDVKIDVIKKPTECPRPAKAGDLLKVHYNGTFAHNNHGFDSSHARGAALNFQLGFGEVIPGWEKGLVGMCVGEVRRIAVPPHLGYGQEGTHTIPGDTTLHFEIELLEVKDGAAPKNIFKHVDKDDNKKLDKEEVAAYFKNEALRLNLNTTEWDVSDMVWEIFEIDDRNKDGLISRREFSGPIKGSDEL